MQQQPDAVTGSQGDNLDFEPIQFSVANTHPLLDSVPKMDADKVQSIDRCPNDEIYGDDQPACRTLNGSTSFIATLMRILDDAEKLGFEEVVGWEKDEKSFRVRTNKEFEARILPKYLNQTRIRSFQRQLIAHGFTRIQGGPERGTYQHPLFDRNNKSRSLTIKKALPMPSKSRSLFQQFAKESSAMSSVDLNATDITDTISNNNSFTTSHHQQQHASTDPSMSSHFMKAAYESRPWFIKKRSDDNEIEQSLPSRDDILLGRFSSSFLLNAQQQTISALQEHNQLNILPTQFIQQQGQSPTDATSSSTGYTPIRYPQQKESHESLAASYTPSHPDLTPSMMKSACPYPMMSNQNTKINRMEVVRGILNDTAMDVSDPVGFLPYPLNLYATAGRRFSESGSEVEKETWSSSSIPHPATLPDAQELTSISLF